MRSEADMKKPRQTAAVAHRKEPATPGEAETRYRRVEELATLQATVLDITVPHDLPALLQTIVDRAVRLLNGHGGGLYLCDEKRRECRLEVSYKTPHDYTGTTLQYGEGAAGLIAQTGEPLLLDDYRIWPGRARVFDHDEPFRAVVGVPMIWQGQVIGVIDVFRVNDMETFTSDDQELLTMFANHAAIATANARLVEGLKSELAERKRVQQTVTENELKYRALFNTANEAILLMEGERLIDCNPKALTMFGLPKERILGLSLWSFSPVKQPDGSSSKTALARKVKAALRGEAQSFEWQYQRGDGAQIETEVSLNRIDLNGKPYLQVIVHDITERKHAENALREAETRYRTLVEQITAVIYADAVDNLSSTLYISPQVTALTGYPPERWIADPQTWWKLIHPEDVERVRAEHRRSNRTGEPFNVEYRIVRPDGRTVWIHDQAVLIKDSAGAPPRWQGLMVDTTARKQAETALRESQQILRSIIDTIPVRVFWKDRDSNYLGSNRKFALDAGFKTPEEIIGKNDIQMGWKEQAKLYRADDRAVIESGQPKINYEEPETTPDGSLIWLRTSKIPLLDAEGRVKGVLGTYEDITERKKGEQALRESEEKYRSLVELASDGIIIIQGGMIKYANPTMAAMAGVSVETMVGSSFFGLVHPDERPRVTALFEGYQAGEELLHSLDSAILKNDGSKVFVEVNEAEIQFEEKPAFLAIVRDITERMTMERALRESEEKFRSVIEQASEGFVLIDENGRVSEWNKAEERIWGLSSADTIGKPFWEVQYLLADPAEQTPERLEYYKKVVLEALKTGQSPLFQQPIEDHFVRMGGEPLFLAQTIFPVKTDQGYRIASLSRDISARKQAEEVLQRKLKELTVLQATALAGTQSNSVDDLIERITTIIGESIYPDNFGVILLDKEQQLLRSHASYRLGKVKENSSTTVPMGAGVSSYVLETGQSYRVADVRQEPRYVGATRGIRSELCVPLLVAGRPIGVINAESRQPDFFSSDDERLLSTIAVQMGIAIEKLRLLDVERSQRQAAETLRQAAAAVSSSLEPRQVLESILVSLNKVVPFDSASVMLLDGEVVHIMAFQGFDPSEEIIGASFPASNGLLEEVSRTRKALILPDASQDARFEVWGGVDYVRGWMGVPLIVRDEVIGFITLDNRRVLAYDEESAALAQTFAHQAAVAIENARLYQQAVQASERRAILHQASQEIARASQDPERIYEAVHHAASQVMPAETFVISLLNEADREAVGVYLLDQGKRWPELHLPIGEGLSGSVIASGKPVLVHHLPSELGVSGVNFGEGQDVNSILAVPMRLGQKVIGMLSAQSYIPNAYTDDDQSLLEMLAAHAAVAIENSRLYVETQRRLKELEVINRISTTLRAAQTVEEMLPLLLSETLQVLESGSGAIWLYDRTSGLLKEAAARGWFAELHEGPVKSGEGVAGTVFQTNQPVILKEFATDPMTRESFRKQVPPGWGGACVPIRTMQETIGVLFVSVALPRQIQPEDVHLLSTISEIAGNAIRRADLHEQTERQVQRLASLRAIDTAISTILDLRVTLGVLIDHIISQLKVDAVDVLLLNPNTQTLEHAASIGFRTDAIKHTHLYISESLAGDAVRKRELVYIPRLAENDLFARRPMSSAEGFVTYFGVPLIAKGQVKGILEIFHRSLIEPDAEWRSFLETLAGQTAIALDNAALFEDLQRTNLDLSLAYDATIEGWSRALDLRDQETEGHTLRVTEMTLKLARMMGARDPDLVQIRRGALLHDIGKMGVPDSILYKEGSLTGEEWEIMHRHPNFAHDMLLPISYLRLALDIPYCHHERWDGSGYPRGLKAEQIPMDARVFAVVDVWDALTSDRPYRKAWTEQAALEYIQNNAGSQFDPKVVEMFLRMIAEEKKPLV
jgi:PAS domain S-box-containing protein/putative nucleotidyltransferase with HDIG domain